MAEEYRKEGRGIELTTLENAVQLCTKGEFYEYHFHFTVLLLQKLPKTEFFMASQIVLYVNGLNIHIDLVFFNLSERTSDGVDLVLLPL